MKSSYSSRMLPSAAETNKSMIINLDKTGQPIEDLQLKVGRMSSNNMLIKLNLSLMVLILLFIKVKPEEHH